MALFVLGEYDTGERMIAAARALREAGHGDLDAFTPFPLHGVEEVLGLEKSKVPWLVFAGGMLGAIGGYLVQWWTNAVDYPINVGGRPAHSWPLNIPVTFEMGVLIGAFGAFFGCLGLMRLPRLHHPVFEADAFRSASLDRFWVSVRAADDVDVVREKLLALGASQTAVVEGRS